MASVREVTASYNRVIRQYGDVEIEPKINCYVCQSGHITKTQDIHKGVTPFTYRCHHCDDVAYSTLYENISPDLEVVGEWYRPSLKGVLKLRYDSGLLYHVLNGGLLYRKIEKP